MKHVSVSALRALIELWEARAYASVAEGQGSNEGRRRELFSKARAYHEVIDTLRLLTRDDHV